MTPESETERTASDNKVEEELSTSWFLTSCLAMLSFAGPYVWNQCTSVFLHYDLGLIAVGSDLLVNGGLLYRDLHTVMFPGSYFLLALLFKIFGNYLMTTQIAVTFQILLSGILLLLISRRFIHGWFVLLPAAVFYIIGPPLIPFYNHHWDAITFSLLFVLLITGQNLRPWTAFAAGISGGMAVLCFQLQALVVAAGAIARLYVDRFSSRSNSGMTRRHLALWAGILSVILVAAVYLLATGTIMPMLEATVIFPLQGRYGEVNSVPYGFLSLLDQTYRDLTPPLFALARVPILLILVAPVLLIGVLAIYLLRNRSASLAKVDPSVLILFCTAMAMWLSELHRPDFKRLFWGEPLLLILLFYVAERLIDRYKLLKYPMIILSLVLFAGLLINVHVFKTVYCPQHQKSYITRRGSLSSPDDMEILAVLQKLTREGDTVFIYPYDTGINYLTGTKFPSRYPFIHYGYHTDAQIKELLDDLEREKPDYAVFNLIMNNSHHREMGFPGYKEMPEEKKVIEKYLNDHYDPVKVYGWHKLLKRKH
ncbi:MAG: hypothetical protein R3C24_16460 [Cyanobacteriota/Melainabacteria group bacterium]